ncbi:ATP-binding protein [Actinomadura sp. NBRC 104412]|uniref:ATP-binding protein n=1 Tax=Actinomadura sp. NBRC 104412 TaxID=3032203 RepID=UPI003329743F
MGDDAGAVSRAREWLHARVTEATPYPVLISREAIDDVMICAGEVLANAVQHSSADGRFPVRVHLAMVAEPGGPRAAIRVEVHDAGSPPVSGPSCQRCAHLTCGRIRVGPPRPRLREASDDAESGRGLRIVDQLATQWGTEIDAHGGNLVWFEVDY